MLLGMPPELLDPYLLFIDPSLFIANPMPWNWLQIPRSPPVSTHAWQFRGSFANDVENNFLRHQIVPTTLTFVVFYWFVHQRQGFVSPKDEGRILK